MSQNTQFRDSLLSSIAYCFTEAFIFLKFLQWFLKWHKWHIFVVVTRLLENLMHLDEQMSNLLYVWYPLVPKNVIIKSLVWNQFIFNIRFCQFLFCLHFIRCTSLRLHFLKIWPEIYCFPGKVLGQRTRPFAQGSCLYLIFGVHINKKTSIYHKQNWNKVNVVQDADWVTIYRLPTPVAYVAILVCYPKTIFLVV